MITTTSPDATGSALAGFLEMQFAATRTSDPVLFSAIIACAVPHWFDEYVVMGLVPATGTLDGARQVLEKLKALSFCQAHPVRGWSFHQSIRTYLLSREDTRAQSSEIHKRAVDTFGRLLEDKALDSTQRLGDREWLGIAVEWMYHLMAIDPDQAIARLYRICAEALAIWSKTGRPEVEFCAELLGAIEWSALPAELRQRGDLLQAGVRALSAYDDAGALDLLIQLVETPQLTNDQAAALRCWIGSIELRMQGRVAPAIDQLQRAVELSEPGPVKVSAHSELAAAYATPGILSGQLDLAVQHAERAITEDSQPVIGHIAMGEVLMQLQDTDGAAEHYTRAAQLEPESSSAHVGLGDAYARAGQTDAALAEIDRAMEVDPSSRHLCLLRRGDILRDARRYGEAISVYEQDLAEFAARLEADLGLASVFVEQGQSNEAAAAIMRAIRKDPDSANAYGSLANQLRSEEKPERAIAVCEEALARGLASKSLFGSLAASRLEQDRLDALKDVYAQLVSYDPAEEYEVHCRMADAWLARAAMRRTHPERAAWLKQAQAELQAARDSDPSRGGAYVGLAGVALARGRLRDLRDIVEVGREQAPRAEYDILVGVASAYIGYYRFADARKMLEEAVALAPQRTEALFALSDLFTSLGQPESVVSARAQLNQRDPSNTYPGLIAEGHAYRRIRNDDQARAAYMKALDLEPDDWQSHWYLGLVAQLVGDWAPAVDYFRAAAERASGLAASAYAQIGTIYRIQRDYQLAEENIRLAIALDPEQPEGPIALAELAVALHNQELLQEAREVLAAHVPEKTYDLELAVASALADEGDAPGVIETYSRCFELAPARPEAHIGIANALIKDGRLEDARAAIDQALERSSNSVSAYLALSALASKQDDVDGVKAAQQHIAQIEPTRSYSCHMAVAEVLERTGNASAAEQEYRLASESAPWREEAYAELAATLRTQGRADAARRAYRRVVATAQVGYGALGRYYDLGHKREDAAAVYRLGIEDGPPEDRLDLYMSLVILLSSGAQRTEALQVAAEMVAQVEFAFAGQVLTGDILRDDQHPEEAEAAYRRAVAAEPGATVGYTRLIDLLQQRQPERALEVAHAMAEQPEVAYAGHMSAAAILTSLTRPADAADAYRQAITASPSTPDAYLALAQLFLESPDTDFAEVERLARQAAAVAPDHPDPHVLLGRLRERQDDVPEAMEAYRRAAELQTSPGARAESLVQLGRLLLDRGATADETAAEDALRRALRQDPANVGLHFQIGRLHEREAERIGPGAERNASLAAARDAYSRATELAPRFGQAFAGLGRVYARMGDTQGLSNMAVRLFALDLSDAERSAVELIMGDSYRRVGLLDHAEDALRSALAHQPGDSEPYQRLIELLSERNKIEDALVIGRQMAEQDGLQFDGHMWLASVLSLNERLTEAADAYRQAIALAPDRFEGYLGQARLCLKAKPPEFAEADRLAREAMRVAPNEAGPHMFMADLFEQHDQRDAALDALREAARLQRDRQEFASTQVRIAGLLLSRRQDGDLVAAEQTLRRVLNDNDANAAAHYYLGKVVEQYAPLAGTDEAWRGRLLAAQAEYMRATELSPQYGDAYLALGGVCARLGDIKGLVRMADRLHQLELEPSDRYRVHLLLSDAYIRGGLYEWAIEELNKALELDDTRVEALIQLGSTFALQQRWRRAIGMFERALELDPSDSQVLSRLGSALARSGADDEAERRLRQAIAEHPADPTGYYALGGMYMRAARWGEAIQVYTSTSAIGPKEAMVADLFLADIHRRQGNLKAMQDACRHALEVEGLNRSDQAVLRGLGLAELMAGNHAEAEEMLARATNASPDEARGHLYRALNALCLNLRALARDELRRGITVAELPGEFETATTEAEVLAARRPRVRGARAALRSIRSASARFLPAP